MGLTKDLGRRIELVSMDSNFDDISIALYREDQWGGLAQFDYLVHTYSHLDGAVARTEAVAQTMCVLGGVDVDGARVRFSCGEPHELACRRLFLEACKADPSSQTDPKPMTIFDKKSDGDLTVESLGDGRYRLIGEDGDAKKAKRRTAIGAGLVKLGEMAWVEGEGKADEIGFSCRQSHDELVGLLLVRALNVRGVEREQQLAASRGQLLAPSAQEG